MVPDDIRIVVLQRGCVVVGRFSQQGDECALRDGAVIRRWGTTKGLGQIASDGPTADTVLDRCPTMKFHVLTTLCMMECNSDKWAKHLGV